MALNRKEVKSIADFTDEELEKLAKLLQKIRIGMREALAIEGVYLFQNEDSKYEFHLWFFPRLPWMERFGRKIESVRLIIKYAKENMVTDKVIRNIKNHALFMRKWLKANFVD